MEDMRIGLRVVVGGVAWCFTAKKLEVKEIVQCIQIYILWILVLWIFLFRKFFEFFKKLQSFSEVFLCFSSSIFIHLLPPPAEVM